MKPTHFEKWQKPKASKQCFYTSDYLAPSFGHVKQKIDMLLKKQFYLKRVSCVSPAPLGTQSSFLLLCLQLGLDRAFCLEQIQPLQPRLVTKRSDPRVVHTRSSQIERLELVEPAQKTHADRGNRSVRKIERPQV